MESLSDCQHPSIEAVLNDVARFCIDPTDRAVNGYW